MTNSSPKAIQSSKDPQWNTSQKECANKASSLTAISNEHFLMRNFVTEMLTNISYVDLIFITSVITESMYMLRCIISYVVTKLIMTCIHLNTMPPKMHDI